MTDLAAVAKEKGIRFFLISFTDLLGVQRAKLAPAQAIADMAENGAGFAGFAAWLDMSPADADILAIPDPASLIQLPWKPEVGWLAADIHFKGAPFAKAPRVVLQQVMARAAAQDIQMKHGVECEFFLTTPDGKSISDPADTQVKPCYDQDALMRRYDVIAEICSYMLDLGWNPYQNDHEDANGQFEMNWDYEDALVTADRHTFFKFMARAVAEKHGLRATFMPKPFADLTGNGCHAHVSLGNKAGANLFKGDGELGLSDTAYAFLGGLIGHAPALTAVLNPTVNSYKRLNAPVTTSGATWSPNTISYGGNNRTHMVRIPDSNRLEVRLADGAANPYLLPAAILAAGLDGIATKADPGQRLDIDMYVDGHTVDAPKLPLNLLDAVRAFEADTALCDGLGAEAAAALARYKHAEWVDYTRHLTEWERRMTLDC
ncbi:MAG: type III glutamate--ammonia ligase [Roseicyclus sp.]|jgi:glutamine synthetase|nr:type III glutamate--ammonia ligase [Roseicyclus sp.]